ncbi:unnamed protein product [marine sediment metagenome]|uniref:Uncharacterized protein n=1 Tax=marine sediment metagenome TaxID=412755 RepID=X1B818_9ZZZZ
MSANLAEKVIDTLGLYYHVKNGNSHFKIETNVKDDFISPLGPFKIKINGNKFSLFSKSGEKIKEGELDGIIDLGVLEFKVIPLKEIPKGETYTVTFYPRNIMALGLRNSLAIKSLDINKIEKGFGSSGTSFTGEGASKKLVTSEERYYYPRGPGILRISVYWGDPGNALRIANALSELIISEDKREKSQRFIQSKAFIDSQLIFYQAKLNKLEDEIRDFCFYRQHSLCAFLFHLFFKTIKFSFCCKNLWMAC